MEKITHIEILINKAGLGYDDLGPVDSITVTDNKDGTYKLYDEYGDTVVNYEVAVEILKRVSGTGKDAWEVFWDLTPPEHSTIVIYTSRQLIEKGFPEEMICCDDVHEIWHHLDGFVARAYKWPSSGRREVVTRYKYGWVLSHDSYDRKRSRAKGPIYSAKNITGGHLSRFNRK
jgi:hypothetical protein